MTCRHAVQDGDRCCVAAATPVLTWFMRRVATKQCRIALIACVLACGCDTVFGLRPAHEPDAGVIDAAPSCPAIGTTPRFSALVHSVISQDCGEYTLSPAAALGAAFCNHFAGGGSIGQGPADEALTAIPNLVTSGNISYLHPRLAPEGDRIFTQRYNTGVVAVVIFQRADTAWTQLARTLLASPLQATARPAIGPRCSSKVMTSAMTWHGWEDFVSPLMTGTEA